MIGRLVRAGRLSAVLLVLCAAARGASAQHPGAEPSVMGPPTNPPFPTVTPEELMQPGISQPLARWRAATLSGVRYDLALDVTAADAAPGEVTVTFERAPGSGDVVLDFRGPVLGAVHANGAAVDDAEWRNGHLRIPARHLRDGENRVRVTFTARIAAAGASIIRFQEPDGTPYLYTLLVPADANQLFPSFDQPDLKARVTLRITAPDGWKVLANGPETGRDGAPGGPATWRFAETEPISTYLVAFAAGPWTTWRTRAGEPPIVLYARASRAAEVDADTLLDLNQRSVRWLEERFGMPYPFAKYDMLLAPAFPFGGMEHVGAVFYNESQFVFREPPTLTQRLSRANTIYHEVAHQWFGDLVTMTWFDDLWLKEGFATYLATRMQDELDPSSGAWRTFHLRNKPPAYGVDATSGTTPVWQDLPNLDGAKGNYGPIVYNKAPSVLRQLEFLVGDEAFREGVSLFLRRHAYGNATWRDLLAAVEEASGVPMEAFGAHYILRAGMPRVETAWETDGDGRIARMALAQRPARALAGDPGGAWPGKVRVRLAYAGRQDVTIEVPFAGDTTEVEGAVGLPAPDFVWPNDGDFGYGQFVLDDRSAAYVERSVGGVDDALLRAMLWGALWDRVRETELAPGAFVEVVLRDLPREGDEQIAALLLDRAAFALTRLAPEAERHRLQPAWEAALRARADDGALPYGMRKAALDTWIGTARSDAARAVMHDLLAERLEFADEPVREPTRWALVQALTSLRDPEADALRADEAARDRTPEAPRRAFVAGAAVPSAGVRAAYFRRYFDDAELNEEWVTASLGAFNDPLHTDLSLPYLRPALDRLEWLRDHRRIFFLPRWIDAFVGGQRSPEALAVVDAFLAERPDLPPDVRRKVLQARDGLERVVAIRAAAGAAP